MQFYEQAMKQYNQVNEDPKKKNYLEMTLTLILLIVLIVMIYPAVTHILNLNKEIQSGKVVERALEEKLLALGQAEQNLEEVKEDLPLLELALPVGSDIDDYLQNQSKVWLLKIVSPSNRFNLVIYQFPNQLQKICNLERWISPLLSLVPFRTF